MILKGAGVAVGERVGVEIPQLGERYEGPIDRIDVGPGHASAARGLAADSGGHRRRLVVTVGRLEEAERIWQRSSLQSRETQQ